MLKKILIIVAAFMILGPVISGCLSAAANASEPLEVTPEAPVFTDPCGVTNDDYYVPADTELIDYYVASPEIYEGEPVTAVWIVVTAALTPAAVEQGYILVGENHWEHIFDDIGCENPDGPQIGSAISAEKTCIGNDQVKITEYADGKVVDVTIRPEKPGECPEKALDPVVEVPVPSQPVPVPTVVAAGI